MQELRVLINRASLSQTVDAISAAHFGGRALTAAERVQAGRWIAARQGLPGSYGGTFAGYPSERSKGIVLFTGEGITSASARHILGEEASRALRLLRVSDRSVMRALEAADDGLMRCLARAAEDPRNRNPGLYCCGKCSVGLWRNLLGGGLNRREERLRRGVSYLRSVRDGERGWRRFPFWYTVLALSEMDSREAKTELKYAAAALERAASRVVPAAVYAGRRRELAARALSRL
jgi:hypothetical protein